MRCVAWSFLEFACCRSDLSLSMPIASLCVEFPFSVVRLYRFITYRSDHAVAVPRPAGAGRVGAYDGSKRSPLARIAYKDFPFFASWG